MLENELVEMLKLLVLCIFLNRIEAFEIYCACGNSSYTAVRNATVYSCFVNNLNLTSAIEPVTNVIRKHEAKITNSDVKLLKIHNQTCTQVPEKIGSFFVNVEGLEVIRSELKTITTASLESFKNLKYLNLMKNNVENLSEGLFDQNLLLQIIIISCNRLKIIDSNIFQSLHDLQHVDFRRNICVHLKSENKDKLAHLIYHIDEKCPQSIEVYCTFADQEFSVGNFYTCEVRFWIIGIDYMTISDFQGRHDSGKKNCNVHALRVSDMTTKYFPIHLCDHFPKLEAIEIVGGKLVRLEKQDISPYPRLKVLWLPRNNIESLSNDVFEGNKKLEKISFYDNRLKTIGTEILKPLKHLQYVNFQYNECIDRTVITPVCIANIEKYVQENCR